MADSSGKEFLDGKVTLYGGDNRDVLRSLPDCSVDSIVTDPPYALVSIQKRFGGANAKPTKDGDVYARASAGFMGKNWDTGEVAFSEVFWAECLRVLKPGGHVVAFSGTRTYHRMAVAIEDAGFEIRDQLAWCYGSGFPKSHDVSKGIDKKRNDLAEIHKVAAFVAAARDAADKSNREIDALFGFNGMAGHWTNSRGPQAQVPKCEQWPSIKELLGFGDEMDAEVWRLNGRKGQPGEAWNDAEILAVDSRMNEPSGVVGCGRERTPVDRLIKAANSDAAREWQGWGTALKPSWEPICLARKPLIGTVAENVLEHGTGAINVDGCRVGSEGGTRLPRAAEKSETTSVGGYLNAKAGEPIDAGRWPANIVHDGSDEVLACFPDRDGAVSNGRKCAKGVYQDGIGGADQLPGYADSGSAARFFYTAKADKLDRIGSKHPTVKPVDLMQWLVRLVTPKGGLVLDPFAGSGSTGEAAWREGMRCILIEREEEYQADIAERLRLASAGPMERKARAIKQADNDNLPLFGGAETGGATG